MIYSKIATFFRTAVKFYTFCLKLFFYVGCFLSITFSYSAAIEKQAHNTPSQSSIDNTNSFSFMVWGHPRGNNDGDRPLNIDEIVDLVHELKPEFLVITGDMIQGRLSRHAKQTKELFHQDWDYFDKSLKLLGVPVYRLPGNHDVSNFLSRDIYFERYPRVPYSFVHKGSKFILLDSHGIDQRRNDTSRYWGHSAMPFEDMQIDFIKKEISSQHRFDHIFFFMHHTTPWSEPNSSWWKKIHPLLVGGKTRAIFSGDNPSLMKFAHIEQDGIHYILNNTFPTRAFEIYKKYPKWPTCPQRQLDNIEYVRIIGDQIQYRTYVIGAMSKENLSWRYWDEVDKLTSWQKKLVKKLNETMFNSLRKIALFGITFSVIGLVTGIGFISILQWLKNK